MNTTSGHDNDFDADLYARLSKDFAETNRVGIFLYKGRNTLREAPAGDVFRNRFNRWGADADVRFRNGRSNLYGLYMWGANGNAIGEGVPEPRRRLQGGFLQFDHQVQYWLTLTARYSVVRIERNAGSLENEQNFAIGAQAWFLERLKIAVEHRFRNRDRSNSTIVSIDFVL